MRLRRCRPSGHLFRGTLRQPLTNFRSHASVKRLQVLEQAILPQKPIKPNRPQILGLALLGAVVAGFGGVFAVELFDRTIRGTRDLVNVADSHLIVTIPYISTRAELGRKKSRIVLLIGILLMLMLGGLLAIHFLWRPLDEVWTIILDRLLAALSPGKLSTKPVTAK